MRARWSALLVLLAGIAIAAQPDWYYADIETSRGLSTKKLFYLEQKAGLCPTPRDEPESLNVRMVGKWGGGPSWGVTGRDTLVYLSRGSEVVVINFADTANPQILNYIQTKRLAGRPVLQGNRLYLATSGYIEVFDITDPTNAPRIGRLATPVSDIDVADTVVYAIGADSFKVFSFADPQNPRLLGACRDSGYALDFDRGYAYLCDRWGMYILDATKPVSPHRLTSWGTDIAAVKTRGNHCYVTQGSMGSNSLHVLNVSNPASPWEEGRLSGLSGEDIYLVDTFAFLPGFDVVNIADSSRPRLMATTSVGGPRIGVWVDDSLRLGFVAVNYVGLHALNLADVSNPRLDTTLLAMGDVIGVSVRDDIACVAAQSGTGLTLLDVSDPGAIRELANLDTAGGAPLSGAVVNCESLAYIGWAAGTSIGLRVVDISAPSAPHFVGGASGFNPVRAIGLQESLVYCAEDYKFEVFSVANPRQPVWMGRCNASAGGAGIDVRDTIVFVTPDIQVFNVARPTQPIRISASVCNAWDIKVRDTFAYIAHARESLKVFSVANLQIPRQLSSTRVPGQARSVALRDSYGYLGCDDFRVFDISAPPVPALVGRYSTPYNVPSMDADSQYIFAACYLAGVCVLERLPTGIREGELVGTEQAGGLRFAPNPVTRWGRLTGGSRLGRPHVQVLDALGREIGGITMRALPDGAVLLDFSGLSRGVYYVRTRTSGSAGRVRVVRA